MNEHPQIEDLIESKYSPEVEEHLLNCAVCSQTASDIRLLDLSLQDLQQPFAVSGDKNRKILEAISLRSVDIRRILFRHKTFIRIFTAAAAIVLASGLWYYSGHQRSDYEANAKVRDGDVKTQRAEDYNGDGQVNVIDSFLFAKDIERDEILKKFDLNDDGQTGKEDLVILRNKVVAVGGGE